MFQFLLQYLYILRCPIVGVVQAQLLLIQIFSIGSLCFCVEAFVELDLLLDIQKSSLKKAKV